MKPPHYFSGYLHSLLADSRSPPQSSSPQNTGREKNNLEARTMRSFIVVFVGLLLGCDIGKHSCLFLAHTYFNVPWCYFYTFFSRRSPGIAVLPMRGVPQQWWDSGDLWPRVWTCAWRRNTVRRQHVKENARLLRLFFLTKLFKWTENNLITVQIIPPFSSSYWRQNPDFARLHESIVSPDHGQCGEGNKGPRRTRSNGTTWRQICRSKSHQGLCHIQSRGEYAGKGWIILCSLG